MEEAPIMETSGWQGYVPTGDGEASPPSAAVITLTLFGLAPGDSEVAVEIQPGGPFEGVTGYGNLIATAERELVGALNDLQP
jgi:hypothetical protein